MAERTHNNEGHLSQIDKALLELAALDQMTADDILKYRRNFEFFVQNRPMLEERFDGQWVASIDQQFYGNPKHQDLFKDIENIPNSNRAYIEQIHRGFPPRY